MKKYLNTLFVTTQGAYLSKEGECAVIKIDKDEKVRIPLHMLDGIICFGSVTCSPYLFGHCAETGVTVTFLSQVVKENAARFSTDFQQELLRVTFHSALHLIGYDDQSPLDRALMQEKELFYLSEFTAETS